MRLFRIAARVVIKYALPRSREDEYALYELQEDESMYDTSLTPDEAAAEEAFYNEFIKEEVKEYEALLKLFWTEIQDILSKHDKRWKKVPVENMEELASIDDYPGLDKHNYEDYAQEAADSILANKEDPTTYINRTAMIKNIIARLLKL